MNDLERFCLLVLDDDALRATLDLDDEAAVVERVIAAAGFALSAEIVRAEMAKHQRSWFERWI